MTRPKRKCLTNFQGMFTCLKFKIIIYILNLKYSVYLRIRFHLFIYLFIDNWDLWVAKKDG